MTDPPALTLGFSPCPNDTFIFNGLVHDRIPLAGWRLGPVVLEDVETLNAWALQGRLDITKLSFHALGHVQDQYQLLATGAALGRGCGPLLITGDHAKPTAMEDWTIAIPGTYTTAALLLRLYRSGCRNLVVRRFDQIMEALVRGEVDGGVIIHESRFTYQALGLSCVVDLGAWWEQTTGLPIPLGCIAAKKSLPSEMRDAIEAAIGASLAWAQAHPDQGVDYLQAHAQEMDPQVMHSHIALYVNDYSKGLGSEGLAAVDELLRRGAAAGLFPERCRQP